MQLVQSRSQLQSRGRFIELLAGPPSPTIAREENDNESAYVCFYVLSSLVFEFSSILGAFRLCDECNVSNECMHIPDVAFPPIVTCPASRPD